MIFSRSLAAAAATLALAGLASADPLPPGLTALGPVSPTQAAPTPTALAQIQALLSDKAHRTPAQKRLDSNLLAAARIAQGRPVAPGVGALRTQVGVTDLAGRVEVDVDGAVTPALLAAVKTVGGIVESSFPQYATLRALVPLSQLETLAGRTDVRFIKPAQQAHTVTFRGLTPSPAQPLVPRASARASRAEAVRQALPGLLRRAALTTSATAPAADPADPEGDFAERAGLARATFGATGAGIKVGVLSNSVDYLADAQKAGALGPVTVLPGQGDTGVGQDGEGTAMLEIVHKIAPQSSLYFATANGSEASFAYNIQALQAAGCNVIVDDVYYYDEPPFQDGIIAQAVDAVVAKGAMYFSSAGNNYSLDSASFGPGTSATWEGNWVDSGQTYTYEGGVEPLLQFAPAVAATKTTPATPQITADRIAAAPNFFEVADLFWADPLGGATDDYDLFVLDHNGTLVAASTNTQDGTQDPFEQAEVGPGDYALVGKYAGNGVFLHLDVDDDGAAIFATIGTDGATRGHAAAAGAFGVAAADASIPYGRGTPFNSKDVPESFSSDGPRRVFFNADGTPITPGNFSSTGGVLRLKPTVTASDGVTTVAVPGLTPFYGTSAAAPHAAAIAALALSNNPALRPGGIYEAISSPFLAPSAAIDILAPGYDRDSGYGILDAYNLLRLTAPTPKVMSFTPASGPVGTTVVINVSQAHSIYGALFHGVFAPVTVLSNTQIAVTVPAGATTGPLELIIYQFGANVLVKNPFVVTTPTHK